MTAHLGLIPHDTIREDRADGTILLRSAHALRPVARSSGDWLHRWAGEAPERTFLAERDGDGWLHLGYGETLEKVQTVAGHLMTRDLGPERPILIVSGNGIDHALLTLAAQYVGIPTVPVAEQYALIPAAHGRLDYVVKLVTPGMVFAADVAPVAGALGLPSLEGVEVVSCHPGDSGATDFASFLQPHDSAAEVSAAFDRVGPETLAKILLTSGSTSDPKGVLTTQGMMTTNQSQLATVLPFVAERPPVIVDWLPWNHVFGGSHNFNLMLANGGSLFIDDGKPAPGLFDRTLENLGLQSATISFNVPVGFAQLVAAMERDEALRRTYFAKLDMVFYAGASLPQDTWSALERMALEVCGQLPLITTSWGLTETAPAALISHQPAKGAGIVGVPLPGVTVKLVPEDDTGRFDVRVAGDSITEGYLRNPAKTAAAFDEEGFFLTEDAMRFVDPEDIERGLKFEGRIGEDFKLSTGTWVRAAALRLDLMALLAPFAQDIVVTGEGRDAIGLLIVPNRAVLAARGWEVTEQDGAAICAPMAEEMHTRLSKHAKAATGSAMRVAAALVMADPPSMGEGEVTAKGNINFARLLQRRAALVQRLYHSEDPARIDIVQ